MLRHCGFAPFAPAPAPHSTFLPSAVTPCTPSTIPPAITPRRRRPQPHASTLPTTPPADLFVDDPYGGFKGTRRSAASDSWRASGTHTSTGVFYATAGMTTHPSADVLLLPGFPCPSFLARRAAARIVELVPGARCISVDWPGVGESAAGQDGIGGVRYGVEYSVAAVRAVADECGIGRAGGQPLVVVAHGYLGTRVGAEAAAALGAAAAVFLAPVVGAGREAVRLPAPLRRLRNPLVGPLLTGNPAHMADAVFASATPYGINEADMMVLRAPYLQSGGPGFAARATAMNVDWRAAAVDAHARIIRLSCPVAFATAQGDRWCPVGPLVAELEAVAAERAGETERVDWECSGHFIFDDAPDDTAKLVAKVVHKCLEQLYRSGAG